MDLAVGRDKSHKSKLWSTVCHRVLVQQDHLLRENQVQRVEPGAPCLLHLLRETGQRK